MENELRIENNSKRKMTKGRLMKEVYFFNFPFSFFNLLLIALIFLFPFSFLPQAQASGLSVTPSRIDLTFAVNEARTASLNILNPTSEVVFIEAYPDDLASVITVVPKNMTLEAGETRSVKVTVAPDHPGTFTTMLSIVAEPFTHRAFSAGTGIKIPLTLSITAASATPWPLWMIMIAVVDVLLFICFAAYLITRRNGRRTHL